MYSVIGTDGQVYGPANEEQLGAWISEGRINGETNLIDAIYGRVVRARDVPTLENLFHLAPPPPPPLVLTQPVQNGSLQSTYSGNVPQITLSPGTVVSQSTPQTYMQVPGPNVPGQGVQVNNYISMSAHATATVTGSPKSKTAAILLCVFLGGLGIHRYYLGRNSTATAMLLITLLSGGFLLIVSEVWAIVDLVNLCTGSLKDNDERALV